MRAVSAMPDKFDNPAIAGGVAGLVALFAAGKLWPSAALDAYLERIDTFNPSLNAFLALDAPRARRDAEASDRRWAAGAQLSPLDGVPLGVKANMAVAGLPWHGGIGAYAGRIAPVDADCIAALRRAGAIIIGTLNMHEAALGATSDNAVFGRCHNPYKHDVTPGGSSGGSASAVAAGLCASALGTDTLGSVRLPAAFCGVFGHKPAHGAVQMDGIMPLSPTLDDVGAIARSAEDLNAVMSVLAPGAAPVGAPPPIRCGIVDVSPRAGLDPAVGQAFAAVETTALAAGWRVDRLTMEHWDQAAMRRLGLLIVEVEALAVHREMLQRDPGGFSAALTAMLAWAARQPPDRIAQAYQDVQAAAAELRRSFAGFDVIVTPTTAAPAFDFALPAPADVADFTLLANIAGRAATAFPIGLSAAGLPLSAQAIATDDRLAIHAAATLARRVPPPAAYR